MRKGLRNQISAAALVATAGTAIFWWAYGLIKGLLFGIAVFALQIIPIMVAEWRRGQNGR